MKSLEIEGRIAVHPLARRAWPWLPALTIARRVYVGPFGELLQARADGGMDRLVLGGRPRGGAAEDPTAGRCSEVA